MPPTAPHRLLSLHAVVVPVILLIAITAFGVPASPIDYSIYPHPFEFFQSPGMNNDVVACSVFGRDYFVYANETTGLNVSEIVDGEVVQRGTAQLPGIEISLAVKDWNIFTLTATGTVHAVSIADPDNPLAGAAVLVPGEPSRLTVENDRLYVACGTAGLVLFDIGPAGSLTYVRTWGSDITALSTDGDRVAVITQGRMDLLDFADPAAPVLLGSSTPATSATLREVLLSGDLAWVGHGNGTIQLDISDPSAMTSLANIFERGSLYLNGIDLVVAENRGGVINSITFRDFSTGAMKRSLGWFTEASRAAFIAGCMVGVAHNQVTVFRDGERAYPPAAADLPDDYHYRPAGFCAEDVLVTFERTTSYLGLAAFEIGGDGSFLWQLDLQPGLQETPWQYCRRGSLAAVLSSEGTNQETPAILRLATVSRHGAVARGTLMPAGMMLYADSRIAFLDDETLLILENFDDFYGGPQHLRVIDVTDPDYPIELDRVLLNLTRADKLQVSSDLVLVAAFNTCEIVLAADRLALQPTGARDLGTLVDLHGQRLFVTDSESGSPSYPHLDTYDLTDPLAPDLIGSLALESNQNLVVGDGWAVQTLTGYVFDLDGPDGAALMGNLAPEPWRPQNPLVNSEFVMYHRHVGGGSYLLSFLPAPGAQGVVSAVGDEPPRPFGLTFTASPNPFNPRVRISFELTGEAAVALRILDVRGRLVNTLVNERRSAGLHVIDWNGRDEAGRPVAAGVYFANITRNGDVATRKLTLVK